jgi:hypothetical protein
LVLTRHEKTGFDGDCSRDSVVNGT